MNTHTIEIIAVICCFLNIYLAARAHALNFLFGTATVILYFFIFLDAKLYANMGLQIIFLILQGYGCYQWLFGNACISEFNIKHIPVNYYFYGLLAASGLFAIIAFILSHYTDSTTVYMDAAITALSLVAQWLMSRKWLAHWWYWMLIDILAIKLYLDKALYFSSFLYAALFLLCIYGYIHWKKQLISYRA